MKKISIGILGIAICAVLLFTLTGCSNNPKGNSDFVTLTSSDNKFQVSIPYEVDYRTNTKKDNDYSIDIYSVQDEMYFYATSIEKQHSTNLKEIVNNDKTQFLSSSKEVKNSTDVTDLKIGSYMSYEYSFIHFEEEYGKDFYSRVVWIEAKNNVYVFNLDVVSTNLEKYTPIFDKIINSFQEL